MLFFRPIFIAAMVCGAAVLRAQEPLTSLTDVKKLSLIEAEQQQRSVILRGICTAPSRFAPRATFFQDGNSITVVFPSVKELPPANTEVEVAGVTRTIKPRGFEELAIEVRAVRLFSSGVTPPAIRVPLEALNTNAWRDRWVETEGVVVQMRIHEGDLQVFLAGPEGFSRFLFRGLTELKLPEDWLHSRLRVRGVGLGVNGTPHSLAVNDFINVSVLDRGVPDPFAAPETKAADLLKDRVSSAGRLRLTATVLHAVTGEVQYLRSSDGTPFLADVFVPWEPSSTAPHLTSPVPPVPVLHAGDVVELAGSPRYHQGGLHMSYCHLRVLRSGGDPEPRRVDGATLHAGAAGFDLVTIRGRLVSQSVTALSPARQQESLSLESGGVQAEVFIHSSNGSQLPQFSADDLIEATGLAVPGVNGTGRLMLRSATDIHSLGLAPEIARVQRWRNAAIAGGGTLLAGGVIFMLRRRLVKERALAGEVRLLNTTLEARVAERTAELEKAREDLKAALQEEREVGELKSRFVSSVSHEFRTPLGVIMSATDIISRYRDRIPAERLEEHLTEIRHATRHMSGMMENILLLGRTDAGRLALTLRACDLAELCHRISDETRSAVSQRSRTLITSDPLPGLAQVDEVLLRHIVTNLLANAVKYSQPDSPVEVHLSAAGPNAVIRISDHGIGIPEEDARRLFQPFARGSNVGERPGTGLGLVIVKRCAELHGGNVTFSSQPGCGSTFVVTLPVWG